MNEQLQTYHDRQGIDMTLAMSVGGRQHQGQAVAEQQMPNPAKMHAGHARTLSWEVTGSGDALGSVHSFPVHPHPACTSS